MLSSPKAVSMVTCKAILNRWISLDYQASPSGVSTEIHGLAEHDRSADYVHIRVPDVQDLHFSQYTSERTIAAELIAIKTVHSSELVRRPHDGNFSILRMLATLIGWIRRQEAQDYAQQYEQQKISERHQEQQVLTYIKGITT